MKFAYYIVVPILIVLNGVLNLRVINLFVTLPAILVVLFFLSRKKTTEALFWHTIFFVTSYSNILSEDFILFYGIDSNTSYNYAHFSFHGIRYSLVITYLILLVQHSRKKLSALAKQTAFYKLYRFLLYCVVTGFVLGSLGLMVLDYSFHNFLNYGYYALFCFGFAYSYLFEYETTLKDNLYAAVPYIISVAVLFGFIGSFFGLKANLIVIGSTSLGAYCFVLIPLLVFDKKNILYLIIIGLQLYSMTASTSGKQIYSLIIMFAAAFILSFMKRAQNNLGKSHLFFVRLLFFLVILGYPMLKQTAFSVAEERESNSLEWKMENVETMSNFFMGQSSMKSVSRSPYIRLAEISNIIYEDIQNPLYLLFGRGFGGYYRDELHLFTGIDLAKGAFSDDQIRSGKFSYGHDSFVTVPMLNGFIGFFLLIYVIVATCKQSPQNYLYLTSLMLLLLWFYFDILMGVIGVVLLFAAEHRTPKRI